MLKNADNDQRPFFTVIIPLYNKENHIIKCVTSVLEQSYSEFELLVVDDASTDGSKGALKEINDERLKVISRLKPGPGGYAARNYGASIARADWLTFLDADDYWYNDHLETVKAEISNFPEVMLFSTGFEKIGKKMERVYTESTKKWTSSEAMSLLSKKDIFHINSIAVRKTIYSETGGFIEHLGWKRGGDSELWPRLLAVSKSVVFISKVTTAWDIRNSDITVKSFESDLEHPVLISFKHNPIKDHGKIFRKAHHAFSVRKQLMWDAKAPVGKKPIWKSFFLFLKGPLTSRTIKEFTRFLRISIFKRMRS